LILGAHYAEAERFLNEAMEEIERFGLAFARLHLQWSLAAAAAGLRKFSNADERLRTVERYVGHAVNPHLELNSRVLRARLLMMQHRVHDALRYVSDEVESPSSPGMYGEYLGVQALAHALASDNRRANAAADAAQAVTRAIEGKTYAAAARAVAALNTPSAVDAARNLLGTARDLGAWDAFVCAVRASAPLAQVMGSLDGEQATLVRVLTRSGDHALVRSLGLTRGAPYTRGAPLLTPRELEIIDLLRQGLRNKEIARALFISEATVKVHVQHIREKLGARTRAEAVARYAEIAADDMS
jgi:DNA-binding NarL/FixJ family response regulator